MRNGIILTADKASASSLPIELGAVNIVAAHVEIWSSKSYNYILLSVVKLTLLNFIHRYITISNFVICPGSNMENKKRRTEENDGVSSI